MREERKRKGRATRDDGFSSLYGGQQKSGKFPFFFSFWVMLIIRQMDLPTKYRRGGGNGQVTIVAEFEPRRGDVFRGEI